MDTFWLKVVGVAVGGLVLIVVGAQFFGGDETSPSERSAPSTETKSFARQVEEDRERLGAEPQPIDPAGQTPPAEPALETQLDPAANDNQPEVAKPTIIYVKPLQDFEELEAQRIWSTAMPGRSIGRLPATGYSLVVKGCSEIIERWPDSKYAFMATRTLNDIPENRRGRAGNVNTDLSRFYQKRPGTQPMQVAETE